MQNLDYNTRQLVGDLYRIDLEPKPEHLLSPGDVIFVSKGANNVAVHLDAYLDQISEQAVAAPAFFVLRSTSDRLLPSYLACYINSRKTQQRLKVLARGSVVPIVTMQMIQELQIPLPPIEAQRSIVELERLAITERQLVKTIQEKRALLIESYLNNTTL